MLVRLQMIENRYFGPVPDAVVCTDRCSVYPREKNRFGIRALVRIAQSFYVIE